MNAVEAQHEAATERRRDADNRTEVAIPLGVGQAAARLDRLVRSMRRLLSTDIGHSLTCSEIPSLTVAESWLPTVVSGVVLTVSRTM